MMTAYATLENAVLATKRGAYDFLAKPFTPGRAAGGGRQDDAPPAAHAARRAGWRSEKRQVRFQFLSVIVHELKAPLAAIEGYLYILKDRTAGDDPAVLRDGRSTAAWCASTACAS